MPPAPRLSVVSRDSSSPRRMPAIVRQAAALRAMGPGQRPCQRAASAASSAAGLNVR